MLAVNEIETTGHAQREEQDSRIAETLTHILRSPRFKDSLQLQSLLRYVVDEAMKGNDDLLKERMIGIYVFGRRPDYDTTDDPIVRSRMGLLRKRLAQYYEGDAGDHAAVQIVIPNGTYRPAFTFRPVTRDVRTKATAIEGKAEALATVLTEQTLSTPDASATPVTQTETAIPTQPARSRPRWIPLLAGVAAVLAVVLLPSLWFLLRPAQTNLDALWAPILKGKQPIYVYTGSMPVFEKESPADEATSTEDLYWPIRLPDPPAEDLPQTANLVYSYGEGMLTGSVYADIRVAGFLSKYNRTPVLRSGANLPYMDLKGSPLILIGSFDNYWTRVMNQDLPFYFDRGFGIRERDGTHRRWHNPLKAEMTPRMMDDYALVFRVMDSRAGAPVLAIAGLSTCGTHAAADFVTDPAQMQALSGIPRAALMSKNVELVLHTSLVNCAPTSVQVIASKVW
jgi:hypothetical protein